MSAPRRRYPWQQCDCRVCRWGWRYVGASLAVAGVSVFVAMVRIVW